MWLRNSKVQIRFPTPSDILWLFVDGCMSQTHRKQTKTRRITSQFPFAVDTTGKSELHHILCHLCPSWTFSNVYLTNWGPNCSADVVQWAGGGVRGLNSIGLVSNSWLIMEVWGRASDLKILMYSRLIQIQKKTWQHHGFSHGITRDRDYQQAWDYSTTTITVVSL